MPAFSITDSVEAHIARRIDDHVPPNNAMEPTLGGVDSESLESGQRAATKQK